ncbi:MAG: hypothetical protein KC561_02545 [Myxococcales bacterium]|nr:hypothetical protein [Myxococcales bacterium]
MARHLLHTGLFCFLLLGGGGLLTAPVVAQDEEPPAEEENPNEIATQLAAEAAALYEAGDVEGAIRTFHEAMGWVPDPAFAFNLALLYDSIDVLPQAHRFYRRYLELYPGAPNRTDVEDSIQEIQTILDQDYAVLIVT